MNEIIKDKIFGAFYGCAIGDALGMPLEFQNKKRRQKTGIVKDMLSGDTFDGHDDFKMLPKGTWTDDTSMMLCLAYSLIENGFNQKDQIIRYEKWLIV